MFAPLPSLSLSQCGHFTKIDGVLVNGNLPRQIQIGKDRDEPDRPASEQAHITVRDRSDISLICRCVMGNGVALFHNRRYLVCDDKMMALSTPA